MIRPILLALVATLGTAAATTTRAEPSCAAVAIASGRKAALGRRAAGDAKAAYETLRPFVDLLCLADAPPAPNAAARRALSAYAWLVDDAFVIGAALPLGKNAPTMDCSQDLSQLADERLEPWPWMSAVLRAATIANLKACTKMCVSAGCKPFNAAVWEAHESEARTFVSRPCVGAAGQQFGTLGCLEIRPGKQGFGFTWGGTLEPSAETRRAFCPALYVRAGKGAAVRLELPEKSALRDADLCCGTFAVRVKLAGQEFMIESEGSIRDCFGGTADRAIEEIYRLEPGASTPTLVRDNSAGFH